MKKTSHNKTIYLIRHGQTEGNVKGNWLGSRSSNSLNEYGKKQANDVVTTLKEMQVDTSCIFSSPTPRALETAEIIQRHFDSPLSIEKFHSLSEINLGILEDRTREQGLLLVPEEIDDWQNNLRDFAPPLGESAIEASERFYESVELISKSYPQKDIVVVTHGVVIKLFLARVLKKAIDTGETEIEVPHTTHGSITIFSFDGAYFKYNRIIENNYPDSAEIAAYG